MERATQERLVGATLLIVAGVIMIPWLLDGKTEPALAERELVLPGSSDSGNETRRIALDLPGKGPRTGGQPVRELDARTVKDVDAINAMNLPRPDSQAVAQSAAGEATRTESSPAATPDRAAEVPARFKSPMGETTPTRRVAEPTPEPVAKPPVTSEPAVASPVPEAPARVAPAPVAAAPAPSTAKATTRAPAPSTGRQGWAVQVGSFANKDNAERLAELLKGKSYKAFVMPSESNGRVLYRVRVGPVNERNEAELLAGALREDRQPARVLTHP